jgi:hypothetical protein
VGTTFNFLETLCAKFALLISRIVVQVDYPSALNLMEHLGCMGENNAVLNR